MSPTMIQKLMSDAQKKLAPKTVKAEAAPARKSGLVAQAAPVLKGPKGAGAVPAGTPLAVGKLKVKLGGGAAGDGRAAQAQSEAPVAPGGAAAAGAAAAPEAAPQVVLKAKLSKGHPGAAPGGGGGAEEKKDKPDKAGKVKKEKKEKVAPPCPAYLP